MEKREVKTSWKELMKAFISSDEKIEEQINEEENEYNEKYSSELEESKRSIDRLEKMLEHPDIKVKSKRKEKTQARINTKGKVLQGQEKSLEEEDIER